MKNNEREEVFPPGTYKLYVSLEWLDESTKKQAVDGLLKKYPTYTPLWRLKANKTDDPALRLKYIKDALKLDADVQTKYNLTLDTAIVLNMQEKREEAAAVLDGLQKDPNTPADIRAMSEQIRKMIK